jgi:hypothetical protein
MQLWNFWAVKAEALPVRVVAGNVAEVCAGAQLVVDCFDNRAGREVLSAHARAAGVPLVHAALSGDGTFGLVRWDERFTADAEDQAGQATCEGASTSLHRRAGAALARAIQDFVKDGVRREAIVSLTAVNHHALTDVDARRTRHRSRLRHRLPGGAPPGHRVERPDACSRIRWRRGLAGERGRKIVDEIPTTG